MISGCLRRVVIWSPLNLPKPFGCCCNCGWWWWWWQNKLQDSMVSMDLPSVLKKLRTLLGGLAGRVAGRNKDDAAEALSLVKSYPASSSSSLYNVVLAQSRNVSVIFPSLWPQTTHVLTCGFSFSSGILVGSRHSLYFEHFIKYEICSGIVRTCRHLSRLSKEHNQVGWLQELYVTLLCFLNDFNLQVEVMKAQWIKKERELEQEKENVRKQAALFKQVHFLSCSLAFYSNCQCLLFVTVNLEFF